MRGMFAILMSPMRNRPVLVTVISNADMLLYCRAGCSRVVMIVSCILHYTTHSSQCRITPFLLSLTRLEL